MSVAVLLVVLVVAAGSPAAAALVLDAPVPGPVLARFDAPTRYGAGHRGVDLAAAPGTPVRAPASGRVTFAGRVVDATWVTVDHGPVRTTVGPLTALAVRTGQRVGRGSVLGRSGHAHGRPAVHWSARRGSTYLDPLAVGRHTATLVPHGREGGAVPAPAGNPPPTGTTVDPPLPRWHRARVR